MKNLFYLFLAVPLLFITGCSSDDNGDNPPTETSTTYQLNSVSDPSISGTAKFIKNEDNSVTIELQLNGTTAGNSHPAHIHYNTAVEGGGIALTLGAVDGATGFSTVTVTTLNDSTPITYEALLNFDGYINVHNSSIDLGTLIAQADIGQNVLTGNTRSYTLVAVDVPDINGSITFAERANGEALAIIQLANTPANGLHPAHIHAGSVASAPGAILFTFNEVDGDTGISLTNVSKLDDDTPFGYSDVVNVDGYVNVHLSALDLATLVAQGDIGINGSI